MPFDATRPRVLRRTFYASVLLSAFFLGACGATGENRNVNYFPIFKSIRNRNVESTDVCWPFHSRYRDRLVGIEYNFPFYYNWGDFRSQSGGTVLFPIYYGFRNGPEPSSSLNGLLGLFWLWRDPAGCRRFAVGLPFRAYLELLAFGRHGDRQDLNFFNLFSVTRTFCRGRPDPDIGWRALLLFSGENAVTDDARDRWTFNFAEYLFRYTRETWESDGAACRKVLIRSPLMIGDYRLERDVELSDGSVFFPWVSWRDEWTKRDTQDVGRIDRLFQLDVKPFYYRRTRTRRSSQDFSEFIFPLFYRRSYRRYATGDVPGTVRPVFEETEFHSLPVSVSETAQRSDTISLVEKGVVVRPFWGRQEEFRIADTPDGRSTDKVYEAVDLLPPCFGWGSGDGGTGFNASVLLWHYKRRPAKEYLNVIFPVWFHRKDNFSGERGEFLDKVVAVLPFFLKDDNASGNDLYIFPLLFHRGRKTETEMNRMNILFPLFEITYSDSGNYGAFSFLRFVFARERVDDVATWRFLYFFTFRY